MLVGEWRLPAGASAGPNRSRRCPRSASKGRAQRTELTQRRLPPPRPPACRRRRDGRRAAGRPGGLQKRQERAGAALYEGASGDPGHHSRHHAQQRRLLGCGGGTAAGAGRQGQPRVGSLLCLPVQLEPTTTGPCCRLAPFNFPSLLRPSAVAPLLACILLLFAASSRIIRLHAPVNQSINQSIN